MTRSLTFSSMALAITLGFGLFQIKYAVQSLEDDLLKINRQIANDQESLHVLKAEWSYMIQPDRLTDMAQRHLALEPLTAAQLGSFDTLPLRADTGSNAPPAAQSGSVPAAESGGVAPAPAPPSPNPAAPPPQSPDDVPVDQILNAMQVAAAHSPEVTPARPMTHATILHTASAATPRLRVVQ